MITVVNGFQIAPDFQSASKGDKVVNFTYNEATALSVLVAYHQGDTNRDFVPKDVLESSIWDSSEVTSNSLRKLMSEIRRKLDGSKDVIIVQSIRNKGYKLHCELVEDTQTHSNWLKSSNVRKGVIISSCTFFTLIFFLGWIDGADRREEAVNTSDVLYQSVFETDEAIHGMDYFNNELFLALNTHTDSGDHLSRIVKVNNGAAETLLESDSVYFNTMKASQGGLFAYMTKWREECDVYITTSSFDESLHHLDCSGDNQAIFFDWEGERFLYMTLRMGDGKSARPYKYDIQTGELARLSDYHFDYDTSNGYGSYAPKVYNDAIYTLNIDGNDVITLNVNTKVGKKILFEFSSVPMNFDVSDGKLLFVNEKNQFVTMTIPEHPTQDEWQEKVTHSQQSVFTYSPMITNEFVSFVSGRGERHSVVSSHTKRKYVSDFDVIDFFQNANETAVLGLVPNGYKVELYRNDEIVQSTYHTNKYQLRQISVLGGDLYVGGNDGIFKVGNDDLEFLTDLKVHDIIAGKDCLYVSSPDGVKRLQNGEFLTVASQGGRIFAFDNQCMYEDRVSFNLVSARGVFGNTQGKEFIFYFNNELAYRAPKEDKGHLILSLKNNSRLGEFDGTIAQMRYQSVNSEILFLTPTKSFSRIQRVSKDNILQ